MKKVLLILFGIVLLVVTAGCGGDAYWEDNADQVRACIERGGDPEYAVDKGGYVEQYFGCVMPVVTP